MLFAFMPAPPKECQPYPCHQCMAVGGTGGGPLLTAGQGANAELVSWCQAHVPGAGGNATYFCKDAAEGGLTTVQAAQCGV